MTEATDITKNDSKNDVSLNNLIKDFFKNYKIEDNYIKKFKYSLKNNKEKLNILEKVITQDKYIIDILNKSYSVAISKFEEVAEVINKIQDILLNLENNQILYTFDNKLNNTKNINSINKDKSLNEKVIIKSSNINETNCNNNSSENIIDNKNKHNNYINKNCFIKDIINNNYLKISDYNNKIKLINEGIENLFKLINTEKNNIEKLEKEQDKLDKKFENYEFNETLTCFCNVKDSIRNEITNNIEVTNKTKEDDYYIKNNKYKVMFIDFLSINLNIDKIQYQNLVLNSCCNINKIKEFQKSVKEILTNIKEINFKEFSKISLKNIGNILENIKLEADLSEVKNVDYYNFYLNVFKFIKITIIINIKIKNIDNCIDNINKKRLEIEETNKYIDKIVNKNKFFNYLLNKKHNNSNKLKQNENNNINNNVDHNKDSRCFDTNNLNYKDDISKYQKDNLEYNSNNFKDEGIYEFKSDIIGKYINQLNKNRQESNLDSNKNSELILLDKKEEPFNNFEVLKTQSKFNSSYSLELLVNNKYNSNSHLKPTKDTDELNNNIYQFHDVSIFDCINKLKDLHNIIEFEYINIIKKISKALIKPKDVLAI